LGRLESGTSDPIAARRWFEKAVDLAPQSATAALALGKELLSQHKAKESLPYLANAALALPTHRGALEQLCLALEALERFDEALKQVTQTQATGTPSDAWVAMEARLRKKVQNEKTIRAILQGSAQLPTDPEQVKELIAHTILRSDPTLASQLVTHILKVSPKWREQNLLPDAARAASAAWLGQMPDPCTDAKLKESWLKQVLDWLESEVAEGDRGPKLALWRKDALFASTFATSREAWVSSALRARWQKFLSIN
jgi:hypothetical protein